MTARVHTNLALSVKDAVSSLKLDGAIKPSFVQQGQRGTKLLCAHPWFSAKKDEYAN